MRRLIPRRAAHIAAVLSCVAAGLVPAAVTTPAAHAVTDSEVVTVDTGQQSGPLSKAGLGTLFGVATYPRATAAQISGSQMWVSQHQSGDPAFPTSTTATASILAGTGVKMDARFNDLVPGFPYQWQSLATWQSQIATAMTQVEQDKAELYAIAPFNEPDNKFQGAFMTDPALQGSTYDARVNYLWTLTVRQIRSVDASIPVIGPNYEFYTPWSRPDDQTRMQAFLQNAIATGTSPTIIGWHSLGPSPGDVPASLTSYYRPLEQQLHVPGAPLPVAVEEYGPGTGDFEGVPGSMVKFWADFERYGVTYADMGIYTNPGTLGNSLRRSYGGTLLPDGGWYMMNWYKQMTGQRIFVSRWDTRHYQAADGVASWDPAGRSVTVLVGGEDTDVAVNVLGLAARGLGPNVRVQLDYTPWTTDPNATGASVENGGDPETGPFNLYDKTMTLDASGNLTVPINRMEGYDGYRLVISPAGATGSYPTKYEAENAALHDVTVHSGADGVLASNGAYVGGIDNADSTVAFTVNAPSAGIYAMTVRYANGTGTAGATHTLTVDGRSQGTVTYPATTSGWSNSELRTTTRRVLLQQGANTVVFGKGNGYAELDDIDVRPDEHRYEAEYAAVTDARKSAFDGDYVPDYVGGIDNADSAVDFAVDAPVTGTYALSIGYSNGTGAVSTHAVTVNGQSQGTATYLPTSAWLGTAAQDQVEKLTTVPVTLTGGVNHVVLGKGTGYAELDFVTLGVPGSAPPPPSSGQALVGQGSNRCLDIQNHGTADGTPVQLWDCSGDWNQKWQTSNGALVNPQSGKCLDVAGGGTADGTQVRLWSCNGLGAQQWQFDANGTVTNPQSGKCLDAVNQGTANGTTLQIWDCFQGGTQANQVWRLQ